MILFHIKIKCKYTKNTKGKTCYFEIYLLFLLDVLEDGT